MRRIKYFMGVRDRERKRIVDLASDLGTTVEAARVFYDMQWRKLPSTQEIMGNDTGLYAFSVAYEKKSKMVYHVVKAGLQ